MNKIFKDNIPQEQLDELFQNDEKCLEFIADLKWTDGFKCHKCGNTNSCAGKKPYSKRCTRCKTEESATNGTIFHNCKFPVSKAFYIAYNVCKGIEDLSSYELARRLSIRQMTCWKFKDKIKKALEALGEKNEDWIEFFR
jgi:hypothetical protein